MGMGLLVGVWVARHLGPEQFGLFNYATAIVALFTAVATLGLNNIVVRDLVKNPENASTTMGTAFLLQLVGGVLAFILALIAVTVMRPDDTTARLMVTIFGFAMVFKATDVVRYWFESKVQSKYTVLVENAAFLVFAAIKVVLVLTAAPLIAFVWTVLVEAALVALLLLAVYMQQGHTLRSWRYQYIRAKSLLSDSWPLILSGLAAMIYMRIDQIMLGEIIDNEAVGIYSAAVRISEAWYFIPMAIAGSVFPALIEAQKKDQQLYHTQLEKLFNLMTILALTVALPVTITSEWIINTLYGHHYSESATILIIHVWSGLFVFSGIASSRWFIAENLQRYTFYRTLAGCLINITLNYVLIPKYGVIGSAWASVISQAVASVLFNALSSKTRKIFYMQMQSLLRFGIPKNSRQKLPRAP